LTSTTGRVQRGSRELAIQHGEHEGSLELGGNESSRTRHHADLHRNEDRHVEAVEAEWP